MGTPQFQNLSDEDGLKLDEERAFLMGMDQKIESELKLMHIFHMKYNILLRIASKIINHIKENQV